MERRANYVLVGVVTLSLFAGLAAFVVWLAGFQFNKQFDVYDVLFQGPVRGIAQGGEVHFNGIKVGEVTELSLDPKDPNRVIARVRLAAGVPVRQDSYAVLEPQGITGVNYIQITGGSPNQPLLKAVTERGEIPVIRSQKGAIADLLEGGGTVLQRAVEALDRVNKLLSDENIKTISGTFEDMRAITAEIRERKEIIADAQRALQEIEKTAQAITELSQSSNRLVNTDARRTLANLGDAAIELQTAAKEVSGMVNSLEGPAADFAADGLPELSATIVELQRTARSLDSLVTEVQRSPRGAISKAPAKEIEVAP